MRKLILFLAMPLMLGGCATLSEPGGILYRSAQEKKLAKATALMEQGKTSAAEELLSAVIAGPGIPGVTDEALFRLSLVHAGAGHDKNGIMRARHDLDRLKKEYSSGSWTRLAALLSEVLTSAENVHQQNRKLKELNLLLAKENKEFRQNIEKLKNLELELGRGSRR